MTEVQDKREDILRAANECFARYGYEKTTLDDIGKMVGLNKASLYYYYKNKEAIFSEVVYEETEALFQALTLKVEGLAGCREKILVYVTERLKYLHEAIILRTLSVETLLSFKPVFEKMSQGFVAKEVVFLATFLDDCQKKGEIRRCDTRKVAESILIVVDAVQQKYTQYCSVVSPNTDYAAMEADVLFMVGLIVDGLILK